MLRQCISPFFIANLGFALQKETLLSVYLGFALRKETLFYERAIEIPSEGQNLDNPNVK